MSIEGAQQTSTNKRTRSRKGCHGCKKAKIKCDESKPSCTNCIKTGKACDYSLKLTWGGRPYKIPKVEKLNPVAGLSRQVHRNSSPRAQMMMNSFSVESSTSTSSSTIEVPSTPLGSVNSPNNFTLGAETHIKQELISVPSENKQQSLPISSTGLKKVDSLSTRNSNNQSFPQSDQTPLPKPDIPSPLASFQMMNVLSSFTSMGSPMPAENLNKSDDYESLEESYTPQSLASGQFHNSNNNNTIPDLLLNNITNNFLNVSGALGTLITDDVIQPSAFYQEMGSYSVDFKQTQMKNINDQSPNSFGITDSPDLFVQSPDNQNGNNNNFNTIRNNSSRDDNNGNQNDISSKSLEGLANEYSDDIARLEALNPSTNNNLLSLPYIYRKRAVTAPSNLLLTNDDEDEDSQTQSKINQLLALPSYHHHHQSNYQYLNMSSPSSVESIDIEPIPRGLQPLPDMLLNVPDYYDSFRFYIESTATVLIPVDETIYIDNPFKVVLPQISVTNDGLLSLIVAFGMTHKNQLLGKPEPTEVIDQLLSRSLSELLVLLQNKETSTSDLTLTLVLFLSSFMVFTSRSSNWKVHLKGAKQILLMRGYNKPFDKFMKDLKKRNASLSLNDEIKKSRLVYFLLRWFAYLDVLASLSSPLEPTDTEMNQYLEHSYRNMGKSRRSSFSIQSEKSPEYPMVHQRSSSATTSTKKQQQPQITECKNAATPQPSSPAATPADSTTRKKTDYLDQYEAQLINYEMDDQPSSTNQPNFEKTIMDNESMADVDYFTGFNLKFLPLYTETVKLIRKTNILLKFNGSNSSQDFKISPSMIGKALEIERQFRLLDNSDSVLNNSNESIKYKSVIATNKVFLLMGLNQLYRRVLRLAKSSSLIQDISKELMTLIQEFIPLDSPNELCLILPIFACGCDCENESYRKWYSERLKSFMVRGSPSSSFALELMKKSWQTNEDWFSVLQRDGRDVVFL